MTKQSLFLVINSTYSFINFIPSIPLPSAFSARPTFPIKSMCCISCDAIVNSPSSATIKMDTAASNKFLFICLLSHIFIVYSSSGSSLSKRAFNGRRELIQTTQHDTMYPPFTTTSPVTNPVTTPATGTYPPADSSTPPLVTVPSANPVTGTPIPPATTPATGTYPPADSSTPPLVTVPSANPVTGTPTPPATTDPTTNPAFPVTPGGGQPVTTYPPVQAGGGGAVAPPAVAGQSWCVARGGVPETVLQVALDYACGMGGADCSAIQQGGACYNPSSLQNHASYAFSAYYQKNPLQTSCDFGGAAMLTNVNPSSGSCVFPTSSSASPATVSPTTTTTTPAMPTPAMPTPSTDFSSGAAPAGSTGTPPTVLNASNPALGGGIAGYGETPPTASISSAFATAASFIACIVLPLSAILHGRL